MARKIVQIACCGVDNVQSTQCNSFVFALCSDGSLWQQPNNEGRWYQLTEIPDAPDIVEEKFTSTNTDYAAALRVDAEWSRHCKLSNDHRIGFTEWCTQRLNATKA